jgi:3-hydroxybutyryl-CoA dehydrogenase
MAQVGVAGAGVMGRGVAQSLAHAGHEVVLLDVDRATLDDALAQIEREARMSRMLPGPTMDAEKITAAITCTTEPADLAGVDIVIENITENWAAKKALYGVLDAVCPEEAIFVANTSAIPITRIGSATSRPDRTIGVHFMNPVPHKPVVELIPGALTSAETVERTRALLTDMEKTAVDVKDACGFVSNRVLMLTVNEAAFLVHEGVADAAGVDQVFRGCFGHPMGPLETADLIGIDTILYSIEVLHEHFGDSKYRPCPLLKQMTDAGFHGRKSGRGFYTYSTTRG